MKLVTWSTEGSPPRPGVLRDDEIVDLGQHFVDMLTLIDGGSEALDTARRCLEHHPGTPAAGARLHAPLRPRQLRDFLVFEQHLQGGLERHLERVYGKLGKRLLLATGLARIPAVWYERPLYYKGNRLSVVGHEHPIRWPSYARLLDYELELGMVIGRGGVDIKEADATQHIFGFTIFNDLSARDVQAVEMDRTFHLGPSKSKDFDTGNVLGPCLVTADELDPYDLAMTARVNGETWSEGSSSTMHWTFEQLIAWTSRSETLYPGEVFGSGTVGTGCGLELGRYLSPGDVVELEIEGIGVLRNRIGPGPTGAPAHR